MDELKPAKATLTPEIESYLKESGNDIPLKKSKKYSSFVKIGMYDGKDRVFPFKNKDKNKTVFFCGHESESHRWGVNLDENDFFRQLHYLKKLIKEKKTYEVIIGVRRTNFYKLDKIYEFILATEKNKKKKFNSKI